MPSHVAYPDSDDLLAFIRSLGIVSESVLADVLADLDLEERIASAISEWEDASGWKPFLKDSSDATRYYDPPGPNQYHGGSRGGGLVLSLDAGLLTVTSIHTGWSPDDDGTAAVEHDDYRLEPYNASVMNQPYTRIQFIGSRWGVGRSIRIIGRFGYAATLPDSVWNAILSKAAADTFDQLSLRATAGLVEWKEADVSERYGEKFGLAQRSLWEERWNRVLMRYKRVVI